MNSQTKVINLTPHPVHLHRDHELIPATSEILVRVDGEVLTIPPSGITVRVQASTEADTPIPTELGNLPITRTVFADEILFLRGSESVSIDEAGVESGCVAIVSRLAGNALSDKFPDRLWVVPNEIVRDENGRITGCKSFDIV